MTLLPLCMAVLISTGLTSCTTVKIVESDRQVHFVRAGQTITATNDSVLMPEALYRQYRRVVADAIERESR